MPDFRFRIGTPVEFRFRLGGGPQGPAGASASRYEHTQASASTEWIVNHNLGHRPGIEVITTGGVRVGADVRHLTENQARVFLELPLAGTAICS